MTLDLDAIEKRYQCLRPDFQCGMPECGCDEDVIDLIAENRKLREEVKSLRFCDCGRELGRGHCGVCDNDE